MILKCNLRTGVNLRTDSEKAKNDTCKYFYTFEMIKFLLNTMFTVISSNVYTFYWDTL